jgi:hypothetical protein
VFITNADNAASLYRVSATATGRTRMGTEAFILKRQLVGIKQGRHMWQHALHDGVDKLQSSKFRLRACLGCSSDAHSPATWVWGCTSWRILQQLGQDRKVKVAIVLAAAVGGFGSLWT